jgi:hypothetical protein
MDLVLCKIRELASEGSALRYSKSVAGACNQRKIFATDKGYFGLGPPVLRGGDLVCVMFGGAVPFVLRDRKGGQGYDLAGKCYVQGMMNGRAIQVWRDGTKDLQEEGFKPKVPVG